MSRRNMRPGKCERCGATVAAQRGTLQGPPWIVICAGCLPFGAPARPGVRVELLDSGTVQIYVAGGARMGDTLFCAYRTACTGAKVTKDHNGRWVNRCSLESVAPILERLRALELDLDVDPAILTGLQSQATAAAAVRAETDDRLTAIESELAARGRALYGYQRDGVRWLAGQAGGILADSPGLGKSAQALLAAPASAPILVICPAVAKGVWVREAGKWRPELRTSFLKGRGSFRWPATGELVACNYDILPAEPPAGCPDGLILVCDEAHAAKNPKAARTKRVRALAKAARAAGGRVWLLTGTPLLGRPPELWALLSACGQESCFRSFPEFAHLMGGERATIKARGGRIVEIWQWGGQVSSQVAERLKPALLRRRKDEVLADLPPKRWEELSVNGLDKATRKFCDEAWETYESYFDSYPDDLPGFEELSAARAVLASAKIPALLELIEDLEEQEEPCVVFSAHRAPIDTLGEREGWAVITGDTPPARRTEIENAFQAGELRGVAATIGAGGTAITLTRASRMIFVDQDWTPALNEQAEDRIHRIGSSKPVLYTILVADHPLDRRIAEVLRRKRELINTSVDAARLRAGETPADQAARLDSLAANLAADSAALRREVERALEIEAAHTARAVEIAVELAARGKAVREERQAADIERRLSNRKIKSSDKSAAILTRRGPETEREKWALRSLAALAAHDPDHARAKNHVGFNRSDNKIGHALAARAAGGLTDREWLLAGVIAAKYWRQVGEMPGEVQR